MRPPRWLATALLAGTVAFAARVAGQALVTFAGVRWLPPPEAWMSGLLDYPLLLPAQLLLLAWLAAVTRRYWRGAVPRRPRRGSILLALGALYALVMVARAGCAQLPGYGWLGDPIPTAFHLLLASMVLAGGAWHRGHIDPAPPR